MRNRVLFTIGYEGMSLEAFIEALVTARVAVLADIRAIAHSRRRGFAKTALRTALEMAGLSYIHVPALGNPKAGREAAWSGEHKRYERIFRAHLASPTSIDALARLGANALERPTCLMCMEADPADCHRMIVADELKRTEGFQIVHLQPVSAVNLRVA